MNMRRGDTLVEVAFAIGIFSLVAITVVAVISASTSAAQASLETTLTREDIDSQAEALRFIHDSYVNGIQSKKSGDNQYEELWNRITSLAYAENSKYYSDYPEPTLQGGEQSVKKYSVTACSNLYEGNSNLRKLSSSAGTPFVLNVRKLSSTDYRDVILEATGASNSKFQPATTYPRIMYSTNEALYSQAQDGNSITRIEGLYVIAVKGEAIDVDPATNAANQAAYYDFYIRSCWMPVNADRASTISTLVRLYDPTIIHQ